MPTTRSQKEAMMSVSSNQHSVPSKLRTGSGRINKPGKPTRKQHLNYDPQQNARRQRQAPKLRVMFVRFLLERLEAQGIAVEDLSRAELREHIADMSDNFHAIAANLERDERDVDDLANVFGQIVVPSGVDVADMMDLLESTSLLGEGATLTNRDSDVDETSATSESTADGDDSSESDFADTMLAADETEWTVDDDEESQDEDDQEDDDDADDEDNVATRHPLPDNDAPEEDDYDHGIE